MYRPALSLTLFRKIDNKAYFSIIPVNSQALLAVFCGKAMTENRDDFILALYLGRYARLRIHECFRMDTAAAEQALHENALTVKGEGGKIMTAVWADGGYSFSVSVDSGLTADELAGLIAEVK